MGKVTSFSLLEIEVHVFLILYLVNLLFSMQIYCNKANHTIHLPVVFIKLVKYMLTLYRKIVFETKVIDYILMRPIFYVTLFVVYLVTLSLNNITKQGLGVVSNDRMINEV
jgi:hypothetical protein